jgi:hypothetical protein
LIVLEGREEGRKGGREMISRQVVTFNALEM